jgi:hypothetical protein
MNYPSKLFVIEQGVTVMQNANLHYVVDADLVSEQYEHSSLWIKNFFIAFHLPFFAVFLDCMIDICFPLLIYLTL